MLADDTVKNILADTSLSQHLGPSELDILISHVTIVTFTQDAMILRQGQRSSGIYIIINGSASMSAKTVEFEKSEIATLSRGDFIGEVSFLLGEPSTASIIATTEIHCLFISNVYLDFLSAFYPDVKYKTLLAIAFEICKRINNTHEKIIKILEQYTMTTQPVLGKLIKSLKKPDQTTFEEVNVDKENLKLIKPFLFFNKNEFDELIKHAQLLKTSKHCPLIKAGDITPACYIIIHGGVQSSIIYHNKLAKLSVIGPNQVFCNAANIDKAFSSTINFSTCEQTVLLKLSEDALADLQKNHMKLWASLFDLICKSLLALERSLTKLNIRLHIELYNR